MPRVPTNGLEPAQQSVTWRTADRQDLHGRSRATVETVIHEPGTAGHACTGWVNAEIATGEETRAVSHVGSSPNERQEEWHRC